MRPYLKIKRGSGLQLELGGLTCTQELQVQYLYLGKISHLLGCLTGNTNVKFHQDYLISLFLFFHLPPQLIKYLQLFWSSKIKTWDLPRTSSCFIIIINYYGHSVTSFLRQKIVYHYVAKDDSNLLILLPSFMWYQESHSGHAWQALYQWSYISLYPVRHWSYRKMLV